MGNNLARKGKQPIHQPRAKASLLVSLRLTRPFQTIRQKADTHARKQTLFFFITLHLNCFKPLMSRSHDARAPAHKNSKQQLARMCVPKMVKNGFNSGLPVSPVFEETKYTKKSGTDTKPKAVPRSWRVNKNYFRLISEQACALL